MLRVTLVTAASTFGPRFFFANRGGAGGRKQPESIKLKKLKIKKSKRDRGYDI